MPGAESDGIVKDFLVAEELLIATKGNVQSMRRFSLTYRLLPRISGELGGDISSSVYVVVTVARESLVGRVLGGGGMASEYMEEAGLYCE